MAGRRGSTLDVLLPASILGLSLAAVVLGACRGEPVPPAPAPPPAAEAPSVRAERPAVEIGEGSRLEVEMHGGQVDAYRADLAVDDVLQIVVDQRAVDVVIAIFDPEGRRQIEFDSTTGRLGPEPAVWLATVAGAHVVEVRGLGDAEVHGSYELTVLKKRPATDEDRLRMRAARAHVDGYELSTKTDPESVTLAIRRLEEALATWRELHDLSQEGEALMRLGYVYRVRREDLKKASECYQQAVKVFGQADQARRQASAEHALGRVSYLLGETESARQAYQHALSLWRQVGDPLSEIQAATNLGLVYRVLGEDNLALVQYDQVIQRARNIGARPEEAAAFHNRGKCYLALGELQQAEDDLEQALTIKNELGVGDKAAATIRALGHVFEAKGSPEDFEKALELYRKSREVARDLEDRFTMAHSLVDLGRASGELGRYEEALGYFTEALSILHDLGIRYDEASVLHDLGWIRGLTGHPRQALEDLEQALRMFQEIGSPSRIAGTLLEMAVAQRQIGDLPAARQRVAEAAELVETLRLKPGSLRLRAMYFATHQDLYDFYVDLLMEMNAKAPEGGWDAEALKVAEQARARTLIENLEEHDAKSEPELHAKEEDLERRINAIERQRLLLSEGDGEKTQPSDQLDRDLRRLLREYEVVLGQERQSQKRSLISESELLGLNEIQAMLDGETALLEYRLGRDRSFLWIVTDASFQSFELPARDEVESLATRTYRLLSASNRRETRGPLEQALSRLAGIVLPVERSALGNRRHLLLVTDGALQFVPFGALPDPDDPAGPLIGRFEISSMPSVSALGALKRRLRDRPGARGLLAVIADPVFQRHDPRFGTGPEVEVAQTRSPNDLGRFERLVYSGQEAAAILELAPPDQRFAALGFAANRKTVFGPTLAHYRYVHFATHGDLDAAQPELSRLVLSLFDADGRSRDGLLHAHEVYDLRLSADLVVLSGCQTALGHEIRGEGLVGLTQAFLHAGAARVLVSLWQINDKATASLMARLYRYLLVDRMRPGEALRRAQLSILKEKTWQSPYYWAGFSLQGVR